MYESIPQCSIHPCEDLSSLLNLMNPRPFSQRDLFDLNLSSKPAFLSPSSSNQAQKRKRKEQDDYDQFTQRIKRSETLRRPLGAALIREIGDPWRKKKLDFVDAAREAYATCLEGRKVLDLLDYYGADYGIADFILDEETGGFFVGRSATFPLHFTEPWS